MYRVGNIIEVVYPSKTAYYLVGHVNDTGGLCNDCSLEHENESHGAKMTVIGNVFDDHTLLSKVLP